ncbi:hypothetical protein [Alistipes sp.]|uniref:hypothetical protein n=1 Tax=Alistipes sp. TaxID=1872444 RepID=UPI003AEFA50A
MKTPLYITLLLSLAAPTACDDSEVYYTTVYPVVRVEAEVTVSAATPEPAGEGDPEPPEDPLVAEIRADVLASAPVRAGGRYVLDFVEHNGGRLTVYPDAEEAPIAGSFLKIPGQTDLQFLFGENDYTCAVTTYAAQEGQRALLSVTLTEHYRALYPDAGVTRVVRREYTTHDRY